MQILAERWIARGIERGIEQGREEGIEQGTRQGLLLGIEVSLEARFGLTGSRLLPEITLIKNVAILRAIQAQLATASSLDEVQRVYR